MKTTIEVGYGTAFGVFVIAGMLWLGGLISLANDKTIVILGATTAISAGVTTILWLINKVWESGFDKGWDLSSKANVRADEGEQDEPTE